MGLKHCSLIQSAAANIRGETEEQKQRQTHTHKQAVGQRGFSATEAERRGERLRLRHTAETGIKELESKERERIKESEITRFFLLFFFF